MTTFANGDKVQLKGWPEKIFKVTWVNGNEPDRSYDLAELDENGNRVVRGIQLEFVPGADMDCCVELKHNDVVVDAAGDRYIILNYQGNLKAFDVDAVGLEESDLYYGVALKDLTAPTTVLGRFVQA